MSIAIRIWQHLDERTRCNTLQRPAQATDGSLQRRVAEIVAQVRRDGDRTLRELTRELDNVELDEFRVGSEEIAAANRALQAHETRAIDTAIANVRRFHEVQRDDPLDVDVLPGVRCRRLSQPLDAAGLYVPAGSAPLPSAAIMLAVPAAIAGCPTRVLCTPPRADGRADPAVVVAATRAGVDALYKIGGAQAIAAMAFGTESVPKVCKVFGPGNAWVTAAKTHVSADPDGAAIDMPAGPSEVLVIGDESCNAVFVAADLLSQAEHGPDSQALFLTTSSGAAEAVQHEVGRQLDLLPRAAIARAALQHSAIVVVDTLQQAVALSNRYAPEHLILQTETPHDLLPDVRNAGSVFVGPWTPEAAGDYCSGTNHVLPTYGFARAYSGLGVAQFQRSMTVQELSRDGLLSLSETIQTLAGDGRPRWPCRGGPLPRRGL